MASSLTNLFNNLSEGVHKIKCKFEHDDERCETCGIRCKYCNCFLEYTIFNDDLIEYKCFCCNKNYQHKFDKKLKERFFNTYKIFNHENVFLLQKHIFLYEYMDDWAQFNETSLPAKEDFYINLNIEDFTDADHAHAKRICKDFEIKKLGEYHGLYAKSNTILLADIFGSFRNMCLKIHELDPANLFSASRLAWQAVLKKTKVKLDLFTDIEMLLMVESNIRGGICQSIYQYAKANNKYINDYNKNKDSPYLQYWHVNN